VYNKNNLKILLLV